jgi:hypothetical protein
MVVARCVADLPLLWIRLGSISYFERNASATVDMAATAVA